MIRGDPYFSVRSADAVQLRFEKKFAVSKKLVVQFAVRFKDVQH